VGRRHGWMVGRDVDKDAPAGKQPRPGVVVEGEEGRAQCGLRDRVSRRRHAGGAVLPGRQCEVRRLTHHRMAEPTSSSASAPFTGASPGIRT
jgi:hypothetical protein